MPTVALNGIKTNYEVVGSGPPILMYSPGGFDASLDKWSTLGIYSQIKVLDQLSKRFSCIVFDRRETGHSGGRVERITWDDYVAQGKGLLDHLDIPAAHIMGGCMGCCPVVAFGVKHPAATLSMVLYWPVGGPGFRLNGHSRFAQHLAYVEQNGLAGVVELAKSTDQGFGKDPRSGPWAPVIRNDPAFAADFAAMDVSDYKLIVAGISRTLLDRDTAPGAEPEDMMRLKIPALIIPGKDRAHATSAARYLEECLPTSEYWDVTPEQQTEATAPARIIDFLDTV